MSMKAMQEISWIINGIDLSSIHKGATGRTVMWQLNDDVLSSMRQGYPKEVFKAEKVWLLPLNALDALIGHTQEEGYECLLYCHFHEITGRAIMYLRTSRAIDDWFPYLFVNEIADTFLEIDTQYAHANLDVGKIGKAIFELLTMEANYISEDPILPHDLGDWKRLMVVPDLVIYDIN